MFLTTKIYFEQFILFFSQLALYLPHDNYKPANCQFKHRKINQMITKRFLLTILLLTVCVNLFSQTAKELLELGNNEAEHGSFSKAIEYYNKAIEADSSLFDVYYNLGYVYSADNKYEEAIEYYNKFIALDDSYPNAYFALAGIYVEKEDYDKAIELFIKGIKLNPDAPDEYFYLGLLHINKGDNINAEVYIKKAAKLGNEQAKQFLKSNNISLEDAQSD
jgi:Uncharacterized protein conserved in bacteria